MSNLSKIGYPIVEGFFISYDIMKQIEIGQQTPQIPKKFLEAILRELRNVQILQSRRGKNGGYRFNKPPNEIYLTEVMRVIDGPIALLPCVSLNYYAPCEACEENDCSIKGVFETVRNETLSILGNTSIQSLVN